MMPADGNDADMDRRFMAAAIRLSERNVGLTGPNPSVGVILTRRGADGQTRIVAHGVTAPGGRPHGEVVALAQAGAAARGATAYVSLEPCSHYGVTPPCAGALAHAGIARVVVGLRDPDPRVDGRGLAMLADAGILVDVGVGADLARHPLAGFLSRVERKRPLLTLKIAESADRGIGLAGRRPTAISGAIANAQTHLERARSDAILVGIGTVTSDDPMLTCRLPGLQRRSPPRVVYDPDLHMPQSAQLVKTARQTPTWLAVRASIAETARARFAEAGCDIIALADDAPFGDLLRQLAERGVSAILYEAGERLGRYVLDSGFADRMIIVRARRIIGEGRVVSPVRDEHLLAFTLRNRLQFGDDCWSEYERKTN